MTFGISPLRHCDVTAARPRARSRRRTGSCASCSRAATRSWAACGGSRTSGGSLKESWKVTTATLLMMARRSIDRHRSARRARGRARSADLEPPVLERAHEALRERDAVVRRALRVALVVPRVVGREARDGRRPRRVRAPPRRELRLAVALRDHLLREPRQRAVPSTKLSATHIYRDPCT